MKFFMSTVHSSYHAHIFSILFHLNWFSQSIVVLSQFHSPSTRVDTASRASSCTPPALPDVLNIRRRALITWSDILGASSGVTFLRTLWKETSTINYWRTLPCPFTTGTNCFTVFWVDSFSDSNKLFSAQISTCSVAHNKDWRSLYWARSEDTWIIFWNKEKQWHKVLQAILKK